jgi:hypothetical protein
LSASPARYFFSVAVVSNQRTAQYYRFRQLIYICPGLGVFWALVFNVMQVNKLSVVSVIIGILLGLVFVALSQVIDRHKIIGKLTFGDTYLKVETK